MSAMQKITFPTAAVLLLSSLIWACQTDSDGVPKPLVLPSLTAASQSVEEGDIDQELSVELTLAGENTTNAIIEFASVVGKADGNDYEMITKSPLIFRAGETKQFIKIKITGDEVKELAENFKIKLFNPKNCTLTNDVIDITVLDDDDDTRGLQIPTSGYTTPLSYSGYNLVWADEFAADTVNKTNWSFEMGDGCPDRCGWGNNELQYYREDNTTLVDGKLVITAKKQNFGNRQYTSSRMVTKNKRFFKYGRVDIRAALPTGRGFWPALWMLGTNIDAVSWPSCGEIDIMELTGEQPNRVLGTLHYGANVASHEYKGAVKYLSGNKNFHDEFHVFSMLWEADRVQLLVDDEVFHTITPASLGAAAYPFNKAFYFIFNVAVGGSLPGAPDSSSPFPQSMIVDYVRVFQK